MTQELVTESSAAPCVEEIRLLRDGVEAFPAMLSAIAAAREDVVLEMYWLDASLMGRRVVAALAERARRGVAVRVMYDAIGSLGVDTSMYADLLAAGGKVLEFNPIAPWRKRFRLTRVSNRDHRKMLVVDGRVAFVGGLNIGEPWAPKADGGGGWRDDVARIEGSCAGRVRALFFENWARQGGDHPPGMALPDGRDSIVRTRRETGLDGGDEPAVALLGHDVRGARRLIRRSYLSRIRAAKRRVFIANSYFIPDPVVRNELERAARRGVEVRIMLPRISDVPAVMWASQAMYARLMRAGVHVHEWTLGVLHAKTGLVDDWATTGSFNLDYISLRYNLEANVASTHASFVDAVAASFARDLAEGCEEVDPASWARRPWWPRLRSWAFYLARKVL